MARKNEGVKIISFFSNPLGAILTFVMLALLTAGVYAGTKLVIQGPDFWSSGAGLRQIRKQRERRQLLFYHQDLQY